MLSENTLGSILPSGRRESPGMFQLDIGESIMNDPLSRMFEAAGCRTQVELASLLGIQQSSISDAKRRNRVPAKWLVAILRLRGVNPEWVLHGTAPKYIDLETESSTERMSLEADKISRAGDAAVVVNLLRCFPTQDLVDELTRRRG